MARKGVTLYTDTQHISTRFAKHTLLSVERQILYGKLTNIFLTQQLTLCHINNIIVLKDPLRKVDTCKKRKPSIFTT